MNCNINDLSSDTEYEYEICCIYNDIEGEKSKIQNVKTLHLQNIQYPLPNPFEEVDYLDIQEFLLQIPPQNNN